MSKDILIRAGSGLGDSIYLAAIVRHLVNQGNHVTACSDWPEIFQQIDCRVVPHKKSGPGIIHAVYSLRKGFKQTTQFQDMVIQAKIPGFVKLDLGWDPNKITEKEKPIAIVQSPRIPMGRKDGFGAELEPKHEPFRQQVEKLMSGYHVIKIGQGKGADIPFHEDMTEKTSIGQLFDLAYSSALIMGQVSLIVPLAEAFNKKYIVMFSRAGLNSKNQFIKNITPAKIIHKKELATVLIDDGSNS